MLSDFTKTLADSLLDAGENIAVSVSPLGEIGEIYIPGWDMLISPFAQGRIEKTVNLRRFFDSGAVNDVRGKLNFTGKCFNMAVMSALEELECAGKAHAVLEKIYTPAVDFNKVDSIGCRIIEEIVEAVK